jgi:hypothetical protein
MASYAITTLVLIATVLALTEASGPVEEVYTPNIILPAGSEKAFLQERTGSEDIVTAAHALRALKTPSVYQLHVDRITKHAELLQTAAALDDKKAKAYAHAFDNSKNAIRAALRALHSQLNAGHKHDEAVLKQMKGRGNSAIHAANNRGKAKTRKFRNKACPTRRAHDEAKAKRNSAHRHMQNVGNGKVCAGGLSTTLGDMDIDKARPKLGRLFRNKWDHHRAKYVAAHQKWKAAVKVFTRALRLHNGSMAAFKTSLKIEVSNAHTACKNEHKEYNALAREVASNVQSRKNVFISTLVIGCYTDNITSNGRAKGCADRKRRASVSQWNIHPGSLARCAGKATLTNSFGPANWQPSIRSCEARHWNEKAHKEKNAKKEKRSKEAQSKSKEKDKKASDRERASKKAAAERKKKSASRGNCSGAGWCETFYKCDSGDSRKKQFWAWNRNAGYKRMGGACAVKGKYGNRHKYWGGKFTVAQCKAKCDAMGGKCHGITMKQGQINCKGKEVQMETITGDDADDELWESGDGSMPNLAKQISMSDDVREANLGMFLQEFDQEVKTPPSALNRPMTAAEEQFLNA